MPRFRPVLYLLFLALLHTSTTGVWAAAGDDGSQPVKQPLQDTQESENDQEEFESEFEEDDFAVGLVDCINFQPGGFGLVLSDGWTPAPQRVVSRLLAPRPPPGIARC